MNDNLTNLISKFMHKLNPKIKPQKMKKLLYVKFYVYHPFGGFSPFPCVWTKNVNYQVNNITLQTMCIFNQTSIIIGKNKHRKKEMCVNGFDKWTLKVTSMHECGLGEFVGASIGLTNQHKKQKQLWVSPKKIHTQKHCNNKVCYTQWLCH